MDRPRTPRVRGRRDLVRPRINHVVGRANPKAPGAPAHDRGGPASAAAAALVAQALVLAALGVWAAVSGASEARDRTGVELMAVLAVVAAVALALVARGLAAGARWARAPAVVWELIMLPVGVSLAQGIPAAGALLLASAGLVLVAIFTAGAGPSA